MSEAVGRRRRARRAAPPVPHRLRRDLARAPRRARGRRGLLARVAGEGARAGAALRGRRRVRRGGRRRAAGRAAQSLRPRLRDDRGDLLDRGPAALGCARPRRRCAAAASCCWSTSIPLYEMVESTDPLRLDFPYAHDGPRTFDEPGSYAGADLAVAATATVEYGHSLGRGRQRRARRRAEDPAPRRAPRRRLRPARRRARARRRRPLPAAGRRRAAAGAVRARRAKP